MTTTKIPLVLIAALLAAPFLCGQDGKPPQLPNPKAKEHAALASLVGDWQLTCKMEAMPGVEGMEKASQSTGTERTELICNGLWAKSTIDSTFNGQPFQGVWLVGYDPFAKSYKSVWVSSQDEPAAAMDATYDEKTRTWTFSGTCEKGAMRSVFVQKDADNSVETCYMTPPGGKEAQCMEITRTRAKAGQPRDALAKVTKEAPKAASPELARIAAGVGTWDATVTSTMPGQQPTTEKGTETVTPICSGKWTWSDFRGSMMGMPFEGHALVGYDPAKKQYVSFWFDSMSPTHAMTTGSWDDAKKAVVMSGSCLCPEGKKMSIDEVCAQPDANTRTCDMTFKDAQGTHTMKIAYKRAKS